MKKLVFIFLLLFCLTGCANSVELDIAEDIKTKVSLSFTLEEYKTSLSDSNLTDEEVKSRIDSMFDFRHAFTDPYSDLFEEKSYENNGNSYSGVYEYTYTYSNFNDNSVLNNCFEYFGVQEDKNRLYIFATGKSTCAPFKLIVKADNRMVSSNENSKDGNAYIWDVKEKDNDISIIISKTVIKEPTVKQEAKTETKTFNAVDIVGIVIAIIVVIVALFVNKKFKESD